MSTVALNASPNRLVALYAGATRLLNALQPLLLLGFRLYVARAFFLSGLTKIQDWSVTLALFTDEYHVPLLPPALAALMGTATELSMPVLLALGLARVARHGLQTLAPGVDLLVRILVASVFFQSGLTKIASWSSTVSLFENEYAVPFLSPAIAALLGTGVELFFPVLLVLGLGSRVAAAVLFVFNIIAVISYAALPDIAVKDHILWGTMILVVLLFGPGRISLDRLIAAGFGVEQS